MVLQHRPLPTGRNRHNLIHIYMNNKSECVQALSNVGHDCMLEQALDGATVLGILLIKVIHSIMPGLRWNRQQALARSKSF